MLHPDSGFLIVCTIVLLMNFFFLSPSLPAPVGAMCDGYHPCCYSCYCYCHRHRRAAGEESRASCYKCDDLTRRETVTRDAQEDIVQPVYTVSGAQLYSFRAKVRNRKLSGRTARIKSLRTFI